MTNAIEVTCDPERIDLDLLHAWLSGSYWAPGIPKEVVRRSIEGSIPSLYAQYGFTPIDKPEAYMAIRKAPESIY